MSSDKRTASKIAEIEIEDPLNFLTAAEMDAYLHATERPEEPAHRVTDVPDDVPDETAGVPEERKESPEEVTETEEEERAEAQPAEEVQEVGRREAEEVPARSGRGLDIAVKIGALIIVLLVFYIVWLLFLRDTVYSVFGWNDWETAQQENTQEIYVITTSQLNLRNGPSTETGEIVVTVPEGTRLAQIAEADGWATVLYEGQTLYCASEYLKAAE